MVTQTTSRAASGATGRRDIPEGTPCFYCHQGLQGTVILWWGSGADIYLHPACAVELSIRLLRDVHEVEQETHENVTGGPASLLNPRGA